MADFLNGLFISEILADNAGDTAFDVDGDGSINKSDEFIEIQNNTGSAISLEHYELWSETNGELFAFSATDTIAANGNATVVGNYGGAEPAGYYDAGITEGANWIPDGEGTHRDSIFLVNSQTGDYIVLSYGQPPTASPVLPSGFPGTNQIGAGESINSGAPNGIAFARDATGTLIETTPTPNIPNIPCFLAGTKIMTQEGMMAVEDLVPGMQILTRDSGFVPLIGLGQFQPSRHELLRDPSLRPVVFPEGSIGNTAELRMSASHRVLIEDLRAELLFGDAEVLASARSFVGYDGVYVADWTQPVTYFHLLMDRHEVIRADGVWTESLFLGDLGLRAVQQGECWTYLPGMDISKMQHTHTARKVLRRYEAELLLGGATTQDNVFKLAS